MKVVHYYKVLVHDYCDHTEEERIVQVDKKEDIYSYFTGREAAKEIEYLGPKEILDTQEEKQAALNDAIAERLKWMDKVDGYIVGYIPKGKLDKHYSFWKKPQNELGKSGLREIYAKLEKDPYFDDGLVSIERYSKCKDNYVYSGFLSGSDLLLTIKKK